MQDVMKHHRRLDLSVNDSLHYLPQDLYQPYPLDVRITFGKKDQDVTDQLCWENTMIPHMLYQSHQFIPSGRVGGGLFPYQVGLPQTPLELFGPDVGVSSVPVLIQLVECCLRLCF